MIKNKTRNGLDKSEEKNRQQNHKYSNATGIDLFGLRYLGNNKKLKLVQSRATSAPHFLLSYVCRNGRVYTISEIVRVSQICLNKRNTQNPSSQIFFN